MYHISMLSVSWSLKSTFGSERKEENTILALLEVNGTVEILVNMSQMFALELERGIVATNDASEDALLLPVGGIL
jgi:hypothetical protein